MNLHPNIAFFGTPDRAVIALEALKKRGLIPSLIVTQPDRPQGRKFVITPPPVKTWAIKEGIPCLQPEDLSDPVFIETLKAGNFDVFAVVAYGKILKQHILDIPTFGSFNLHASLLPLLRGSCPIETALLEDMRTTGSTIIRMDEKMDHGPIVAQHTLTTEELPNWPIPADTLASIIVTSGGNSLADVLLGAVNGTLQPREQDHSKATFTKKIVKEDGHISLAANGYKNFLAYNAYKGWPGTFFFVEKNGVKTRVNITDATYENNLFVIRKVVPEGRKEMDWKDFEKTI